MILTPRRPRSTVVAILALWAVFYGSFALIWPPLLDDADSVHAEVAREMILRNDYVTLYANGIRYLEKAPLLYWSMALCMHVAQLLGHGSARALAVAARVPLALTVLALALLVEAFARRAFRSSRAGLYAALILLSSPGVFLFTRMLLPDAMVCLWLTVAMYGFWLTEEQEKPERLGCYVFAAACALNVLTKGLIGIVFPVAIVMLYLVVTRGLRNGLKRLGQLHLLSSAVVFFAIAAPWHMLIAFANPAQGHPGEVAFVDHHWRVPMPTDGNVHSWAWFYFVNEQVLRYLNLRVPRDYDTVPLWLFWGLCFVWLMPWSAFVFKVVARFIPLHSKEWRRMLTAHTLDVQMRGWLLVGIWGGFVLLFFLFSTRQEYYVLPAFPAFAILIGGWLSLDPNTENAEALRRSNLRTTAVVAGLGGIFAVFVIFVLIHSHEPARNTDLAALLQQNPGDYALSMGHFLDLNAQALGLFRLPLALAALSLFGSPLASYVLRRQARPHAAIVALAAGAFGFLLAAHLGLQIFAPVLSSEQLARVVASQIRPGDLVVIHQEYEFGSTLGFYLQRPSYLMRDGRPVAVDPIHILTTPQYNGVSNYGRSSNLWYGSFFADAPAIFETPQSLAAKWAGPQRIFLWQDLGGQPDPVPTLSGPVYVIAQSGGKEILSNQPGHRE